MFLPLIFFKNKNNELMCNCQTYLKSVKYLGIRECPFIRLFKLYFQRAYGWSGSIDSVWSGSTVSICK